MTPHDDFTRRLAGIDGVQQIDGRTDRALGVGRAVVRCTHEGRRAVAVREHEARIPALMDLLHLHLAGAELPGGGQPPVADEVTVLLVEDKEVSEAGDALATLAAEVSPAVGVRVLRVDDAGRVHPSVPAPDLSDAVLFRYEGWLRLLEGVEDGPPELVREIVQAVGRPELRAYPMLSHAGRRWSLRIEGLEVGQVEAGRGTLGVGKDGKTGRTSRKRAAWVAVAGKEAVEVTPASVPSAASLIRVFAEKWRGWSSKRAGEPKQDEHALESRVLRGVVPLHLANGTRLDLLKPDSTESVNWGSQFPTRWGRQDGPAARYLDALLRVGDVPWAAEIKIDGGTGTGRYYRHAVAQAVLYRTFIRQASPLQPWFEAQGLDQRSCRAAVVVPDAPASRADRSTGLAELCQAFDVELITVPRAMARLGRLD